MTSPRRRPAKRSTSGTIRAIGYIRVSTDGQVESGAGLDDQRKKLTDRAAAEGWELVEIVADKGLSAKDMDSRPALLSALARLDADEADVLVSAKLDRVSRSVKDFSGLLERAADNDWRIVLLDLGVDTSTPAGEFVSNTLASAAQYERRIIGQRTKDGLAAKRAQGVRLGRPSTLPREVVERIVLAHEANGVSMAKVAAGLDADGIPTAKGGPWSKASVQSVLRGQDAAKVREALAAAN